MSMGAVPPMMSCMLSHLQNQTQENSIDSMLVNFLCQFVWAIVSRQLVNSYPRGRIRGIRRESHLNRSAEKRRLPSPVWLSLMGFHEGLKRTNGGHQTRIHQQTAFGFELQLFLESQPANLPHPSEFGLSKPFTITRAKPLKPCMCVLFSGEP